jgi:hypothetical protein
MMDERSQYLLTPEQSHNVTLEMIKADDMINFVM